LSNLNSGTEADTLTYSYTNNNQLTGVSHTNNSFSNESFTWDSNGNETGTGYTTGTDNEQTASPGYTYTYDNAGEMTSETQTSTGDVWTYGYDFRGQMVTAVEKTSGGTTLESVTYTYDALGNRIGMDENGTQTWTLYDSGNPIMDFNSSGSLTMRYLWGPTGIVARQTSGGTVSWYLADHLGTVRDLINNSGAIIDHVDFSAFGTVLDQSSPTSGDRMMGFAGLERDTVTGLNFAVFREENPGTGRWDSQDPLGFSAGDPNTSRYVGNAPTDSADPDGADWLDDYTRWFKLHGRPGFWEGVIPVWGSGRTAYDDYQNGKPYWGTFWVVVAATDIFLVRSLVTGAVKGLWKFGGSCSWGAVSKWALKQGWRTSFEEIHHWAMWRAEWVGWERIINQPWNFRNFPKKSPLHQAIHGGGPYKAWRWPILIFIGPPTWIKLLPISIFPRFGP
jgi:RHS repeat-associated protein